MGQSITDRDLPRWSSPADYERMFTVDDGRVPLIVPPTLNKTSYFDNELVRSMWQRARVALSLLAII